VRNISQTLILPVSVVASKHHQLVQYSLLFQRRWSTSSSPPTRHALIVSSTLVSDLPRSSRNNNRPISIPSPQVVSYKSTSTNTRPNILTLITFFFSSYTCVISHSSDNPCLHNSLHNNPHSQSHAVSPPCISDGPPRTAKQTRICPKKQKPHRARSFDYFRSAMPRARSTHGKSVGRIAGWTDKRVITGIGLVVVEVISGLDGCKQVNKHNNSRW